MKFPQSFRHLREEIKGRSVECKKLQVIKRRVYSKICSLTTPKWTLYINLFLILASTIQKIYLRCKIIIIHDWMFQRTLDLYIFSSYCWTHSKMGSLQRWFAESILAWDSKHYISRIINKMSLFRLKLFLRKWIIFHSNINNHAMFCNSLSAFVLL